MKASNHFKRSIQAYLEEQATNDPLFAPHYAKEGNGKSIDEGITYILNTVQKSGCNGFTDDEIYSLIIHYYTEDNVEVGKPINAHVVVNHVVELTEQEKEEARKEAIQRVQEEAYRKMTQPVKKAKKENVTTIQQPSLFDF